MKKRILLTLVTLSSVMLAQKNFVVDVSKVGSEIQPEMYGVFFEDINFGADGGLYAELIKNRSFEFDHPFIGWTPFGDVSIKDEDPCFDKNPHYVHLNEKGWRTGTGLENEGFRGMGFKENDAYNFSFYARTTSDSEMNFRVDLINSDNNMMGHAEVNVAGSDWTKYTCSITARRTDAKGKIRISLTSPGEVDLDHISMFPAETWKNRENGLRKDLTEALYDLNPGIFRFPGGCIVEGNTLESRYQWKNSVGPVENRPININRWNYTFKHRLYPDYYQTYGLGFYEFFLLCEDLGAEPLPIVSCGLACQYESTECVLVEDLEPYIQDAVDLIEFANGSTDTKWGAVRAEMGHPEPFNLKMIGVGNEQWGDEYVDRLKPFVDVLRDQHPEIKIVGSSGPSADGDRFEYLWPKMKELKVDLVDEHYYKSPEWFLENAARYDTYDRKGPKVFAGEYAAHHRSRNNNLRTAIAEAAFMTGLERNADVVHMATYAPLLAHVDAWQWRPDMIWFDNLNISKTPNYYVQQLYGQNPGTNTLSIKWDGANITGQDSLYASAVLDKNTNEVVVKVINASDEIQDINISFENLKKAKLGKVAEVTYLHTNNPEDINTLEHPNTIIPGSFSVQTEEKSMSLKAAGNAFYVCRIKIK